jgi:hypothetical protein
MLCSYACCWAGRVRFAGYKGPVEAITIAAAAVACLGLGKALIGLQMYFYTLSNTYESFLAELHVSSHIKASCPIILLPAAVNNPSPLSCRALYKVFQRTTSIFARTSTSIVIHKQSVQYRPLDSALACVCQVRLCSLLGRLHCWIDFKAGSHEVTATVLLGGSRCARLWLVDWYWSLMVSFCSALRFFLHKQRLHW